MTFLAVKKTKKLTFFITIIILFVIGFGFFSTTLMDHSDMQTCPIGVMSGNSCSLMINGIISTIHHIEFSQDLIQMISPYEMVALILIIFAILFFVQKPPSTAQKDILIIPIRVFKEKTKLLFILPNILRCMALQNKSGLDSSLFMGIL